MFDHQQQQKQEIQQPQHFQAHQSNNEIQLKPIIESQPAQQSHSSHSRLSIKEMLNINNNNNHYATKNETYFYNIQQQQIQTQELFVTNKMVASFNLESINSTPTTNMKPEESISTTIIKIPSTMMTGTTSSAMNSSPPTSTSICFENKQYASQSTNNSTDAKNCTNKKLNKKKTTQCASELDEERTSQLVSEILKNIKEKTKELESMNQNLNSNSSGKGSTLANPNSNQSQSAKYGYNSDPSNSSSPFNEQDLRSLNQMNANKTCEFGLNYNNINSNVDSTHFYNNCSNSNESFEGNVNKPTAGNNTNNQTARKISKSNKTTTNKQNKTIKRLNDSKNVLSTLYEINKPPSQMDLFDAAKKRKLMLNLPNGWSRFIEKSNTQEKYVVYKSPAGIKLMSMSDVRNYLLSDGTCKCGFKCPFHLDEVFSFDPDVLIESNPECAKSNLKCCKHSKEQNNRNHHLRNSIESIKLNPNLQVPSTDSESAFKQNDSFDTYPNENYFVNLSTSNKSLLESSFPSSTTTTILDSFNVGDLNATLNNLSSSDNNASMNVQVIQSDSPYQPAYNQNSSMHFTRIELKAANEAPLNLSSIQSNTVSTVMDFSKETHTNSNTDLNSNNF